MADENKPAFYPRVGNIKAKNFRSAQPAPFIDDPRAMDLPQFGDVDLSQPTKANLEMGKRMAERDAQLRRQQEADRSPLEKVAGALEAVRFMGSALTQSINSFPTRIVHGDEAAEKFMQDRIYKPTQPTAYEYAQDVGDFLERLETEYKLPPVATGEVLGFAPLIQSGLADAARKGTGAAVRGGMALERGLDPVVRGALERGGLPREVALGMGANTQSNVIKPKGGNWFGDTVNDALKGLKRDTMMGAPNDTVEDVLKKKEALNNWVDRNLTNYVKKEMATPEDPVRKLAEEGVVHFPVAEDPRYWARKGESAREDLGGTEMAQSDLAKQWENRTDAAINRETAQMNQDMMHLAPGMYSDKDEWIKKLPSDTPIYSGNRLMNPADLGFDHILDVLRQDVAEGRIRPEQLNKVSMEQAVRRTYEYDQEMARKMRETALKQQEGFPLHKEYPEGYRWIELKTPEAQLPEGYKILPDQTNYKNPGNELYTLFDNQGNALSTGATEAEALRLFKRQEREQQLADALKYEGDTMGHCVGGYCPDVVSGRSRIFSLRDTKGEPHVTIEVQPQNEKGYYNSLNPTERAELMNKAIEYRRQTVPDWDEMKNPVERADMLRDYLQAQNIEIPSRIVQIKGKQNARPIQKYDPYTQDFVKSGSWSEVGDLKNTGLQKFGSEYLTNLEAESKYKPMVADALNYLETHPSLERHRAARLARNNFKGDTTSPEYRDLERQAGESIAKDVPYTYAELKALLSSPEDWVDHGETIYTPISTAIEQIEKAKKSLGPLPPAPEMKRGGKVSISNNPDTMMLELNNHKMKNGVPAYGAGKAVVKKGLQSVPLPRAVPKTKAEIEAIAQRMAPQMLGEFVRGDKGTQSVAGKTQKQFAKEKEMVHDIRPTDVERPLPKTVDIEKLKDQVMIGIPGDPTISGQSIHSVAGVPLESPSPQHGGPLYGLGRDDAFWASGLGAANRVQNLAREASQQYDAPVLGKYIMMGPESINYAQHFADANLSAIDPSKMTKAQIESFNKLVRSGSPKSGPRPSFPGIENPAEAYLHFSVDPELRKHFNALMQMPTVTEKHGLPSGIDVRHAVTEPDLRNLEVGVTGKSIGRLRPEVTELGMSEHPTYSHDIPGEFMGSTKYAIPYELSFPDTIRSIRENPKQAPHEFGSLKMVGPRQIIDQQMIDEIKQYEEMIKKYTGQKKGGAVKKAAGGAITGDDLIIEERPL